jgi:hypothetical protein
MPLLIEDGEVLSKIGLLNIFEFFNNKLQPTAKKRRRLS